MFRVQETDGNFFENFAALQWKLENAKRQRLREDTAQKGSDSGRSTPKHMERRSSLKFGQMTKFNKKELCELYVEVLYTIRHKIGATTGGHTPFVEDLYLYAKQAFHVDPEEHAKYMAKAKEEKPPRTLLNVIVIEARDLVAKDANGFSDPYCMLGVMPGKGSVGSPQSPTHSGRQLEPSDYESDSERADDKKRSGSFRRKLAGGGSFRRKNKGLPAKVIKATSVQRCTLNPKWNEKFQLDFDDAVFDKFHLDIWDHDDEGSSVVEAVKKLNEIASLKGLGRYFKQVAQSARCDAEESADDFLGCVTISINDVPSTGLKKWFDLQGRSVKSTVHGSICLQLWPSTREDRNIANEDNLFDIKQHQDILKIFTEHEILQSCTGDTVKWSGQLPQPAHTILHQHAIQGDITSVQEAMSQWLAYSDMHYEKPFEYSFLYEALNKLVTLWVPTSLSKDEEEILATSFSEFLTHCYHQITHHREIYVSKEKHGFKQMEDMLRCLRLLHTSAVFKKCLPFQRELMSEANSLLKKSAVRYFDRAKLRATGEQNVDNEHPFTHLLTVMNAGCYRAYHTFRGIFERALNANYFYITYKEWDKLLQDDLCSIMADLMHRGTLSQEKSQIKIPDAENTSLLPLFELYLALAEFYSYRQYLNDEERTQLSAVDFGKWFEGAVNRWLSLVKEKAIQRVDCACQMDRKNVVRSDVKETSSHADVCRCIMQVIDFWVYLDYPASRKSADYLERLVQDLCKCSEYYSDKIFASLAHAGFFDDTLALSEPLIDTMCATVNNAEHVNALVLDFPKLLRVHEFRSKLEAARVDEKEAKKFSHGINDTVRQHSKLIIDQINMALNRLVDRQKANLVKHVFHLIWSPEGCQLQQAIKPLIDQLDTLLADYYHKWLLPKNFHRLLMAEMRIILQEIKLSLFENPGKEPAFYKRLLEAIAYLTGYFHAEGRGVSKDEITNDATYKEVTTLLHLNRYTSQQLILQYYEALGKQQEESTGSQYGFLTVRAYYNSQSSTLVVDIVSAKNILALDSNGLSDPFVILELAPNFAFPMCKPVKTKVVSKTLNPTFEETFEFNMPQRLPPQGWLHFVVMDHDFLMTNDYAGEAFVSLMDIPGVSMSPVERTHSSAQSANLKQFIVPLMHPVHMNQPTVSVLQTRKTDKEAQDFLRNIEAIKRV